MRASEYPLLDVAEVEEIVAAHTPAPVPEVVAVPEAAGRVLAEDLVAAEDHPRFRAAAVDGYAVRSADGAAPRALVGESAAGRPYAGRVGPGEAVRVLTGAVVPAGADTMVMVEDTENDGRRVRVAVAPPAGRNIHLPGDDLRAGEVVLRRGDLLGAAEVGLVASIGRPTVAAYRRPRVAVLSTGDELAEPGESLSSGRIFDSNRFAIAAACAEAGAEVGWVRRVEDDPAALRDAALGALESADVLVTSGGVSVGTHDHVKPMLAGIGRVHCGRVRLRPGKPFTFATLAGGKVAFGLPGFPVSSLVTFEVFVRPALRRMLGLANPGRPVLPVRLAYTARAPADRTEYQRVTLTLDGSDLVAHSTGSQSSSRLLSLRGANALVRVPAGSDGIAAGGWAEALVLALPSR